MTHLSQEPMDSKKKRVMRHFSKKLRAMKDRVDNTIQRPNKDT